jgi:hypothetical protein
MCVPATSRHFSTAVDAPPLSQHLDGLTPCALCCTATADTFYAGETGCFDSSPRQSCCVGPQVSTLRGSWLPSPSQWLTLHTCLEVLSGWGEYKMDEGKLNLGGTMGSVLGFKNVDFLGGWKRSFLPRVGRSEYCCLFSHHQGQRARGWQPGSPRGCVDTQSRRWLCTPDHWAPHLLPQATVGPSGPVHQGSLRGQYQAPQFHYRGFTCNEPQFSCLQNGHSKTYLPGGTEV